MFAFGAVFAGADGAAAGPGVEAGVVVAVVVVGAGGFGTRGVGVTAGCERTVTCV